MKFNTALGMLLGSFSLYLLQNQTKPWQLLVVRVLSVIILIITVSSFISHYRSKSWIIETLFSPDQAPLPGVMSIQTGTFLFSAGLLVFLITFEFHYRDFITNSISVFLGAIALTILSGYLFGVLELFGQSHETRTSLQTLICMISLSTAACIHEMKGGYMIVFARTGIGSHIVRISFPVAIALPFLVVGATSYLISIGLITTTFAAALMAAAGAFFLFVSSIVLTRKINRLESDLRNITITDELTKVHNRRGFYLFGEQMLREARRRSAVLTVLYFDLDGLKDVNDTFGHETGSQMLADFGAILAKNFRSSDIVARIGGDEFAVATYSDPANLDHLVYRLKKAIGITNAIVKKRGDKPYQIQYSSGSASSSPEKENESFEDIVDRADMLMYRQKKMKKNRKKKTNNIPPNPVR